MALKVTVTKYYDIVCWYCKDCANDGYECRTRAEAIKSARESGWKTDRGGWNICPKCQADKRQKEG